MGRKHTAESRRKLSEAHKGKTLTAKHRAAIGAAGKGGNSGSFTSERSRGNTARAGLEPWNKGKKIGPSWNAGTKGVVKPNSGSFEKGHSASPGTQFKKGQPAHNKGRTWSEAVRRRMSEGRKGKGVGRANSNWIADRAALKATIEKRIRQSVEYRRWREAVFARDNYSCLECGSRGGRLNADHIKAFAVNPELRFELSNGRTLCEPCHRKTPNYGIALVWSRRRAAVA